MLSCGHLGRGGHRVYLQIQELPVITHAEHLLARHPPRTHFHPGHNSPRTRQRPTSAGWIEWLH